MAGRNYVQLLLYLYFIFFCYLFDKIYFLLLLCFFFFFFHGINHVSFRSKRLCVLWEKSKLDVENGCAGPWQCGIHGRMASNRRQRVRIMAIRTTQSTTFSHQYYRRSDGCVCALRNGSLWIRIGRDFNIAPLIVCIFRSFVPQYSLYLMNVSEIPLKIKYTTDCGSSVWWL